MKPDPALSRKTEPHCDVVLHARTIDRRRRGKAPDALRTIDLGAESRLLIVVSAGSLLTSGLSAYHLGHYLDRARANERTLLAEIMAQPVCTAAGIIPSNLFNQRRKS